MHIALIISSLSSGGAERVLSELANYWGSKHHRMTLVTLAPPESQPFYPLDPTIELIQLNQSQAESSFFTRPKNILKRVFRLRKTIRALKPDVIVSFVDVMNITTLIATIGLKIPVVIAERTDPAFHKLPKLYLWLRLKTYPFCRRLIVQTDGACTYFPLSLRKLITIIPNAVKQPKNQKKNFSKKDRQIISIGRLIPSKDHATLIHAFSKLMADYPDLTLTIYGEGQERSNLMNLICSLGLQEKVVLPGTTQNVHEVLVHADLFIFPSRYEGFPNALCEAMAVGLPVIASNCSGTMDIVRDGVDGRLFPMGDVDALVEITRDLLDDDKQRKHLAKNAQDVCNRFHPDHVLKQWDEIVLGGFR